MSGDRRIEIVRHLDEEELDRLLRPADDPKVTKRLAFVKRLYKGANLEDAADDVGKSASTGSRWARRWNEGGLGLLTPNFGAGRPPKLGEEQQEQLLEMLREDQPWEAQEILQLLDEEFDVQYHPDYLHRFLRNLGLSYAKPRPERPSRPEHPDEILEERVDDAFDEEADTPQNKVLMTRVKAGSSMTIFAQMAVLSSASVMRLTRNHSTTLTDCGTLVIRHCSDH